MPVPFSPYADRDATIAAFARHVNAGKVRAFSDADALVILGERSGASFQDAYSGARFWNCHSNGGVFNLGHRHPRVLAAVRSALDTLDIGNHHLVSGVRAALGERLAATTGGRLPGVVFGVSGGEATDLALKVARWATKRSTIVSALGGYHGHTGLALAAGDARFRDRFGPQLPGFVQVPFAELEALERAVDDTTAAVILEPVPATLGMPIAPEGYLPRVASLCRERGAKLILDEVQTGLGRTGRIWCFEHEGVVPDAVVVGKGLSGGIYPITATLLTRELHALFDEDPFIHISTFGGAEPGCHAALAVLDVIEEPGFLPRVRAVADAFRDGLRDLPLELRQKGLMMGLKLGAEGAGYLGAKLLMNEGIFALPAANDTSVVQLLPPLVVTDEDVSEILARIRKALA
jgi:acetylornithine/succinyldiaminopimelate/putrescine aminotransferase